MPPPSIPSGNDPEDGGWPIPNLQLRIDSLSHPGTKIFFDHVNPEEVLRNATIAVCKELYTLDTVPRNVENILLVLRPMEGVAHTCGSHTHKEIHLSLDYVQSSASRARDEITGVLTHEMVHCFQYNALGTCPGWLIEGIADWVRLRAGFVPPHWREGRSGEWDAGYEATGYFLEWIQRQSGSQAVRTINASMQSQSYNEDIFSAVGGKRIEKLWEQYRTYLNERRGP